jgi:adenylate kinase family enzyme
MKIYITGSTGSGKTTTAESLSKRFAVPHFKLDEIVWDNTNGYSAKKHPAEIRDKNIQALLTFDSWIAEGIYFHEWMLPLLNSVDFVLLLSPSRSVRDFRLCKRYIKSKFNNKILSEDLVMLSKNIKWGRGFETNKLPHLMELLLGNGIEHYSYDGSSPVEFIIDKTETLELFPNHG